MSTMEVMLRTDHFCVNDMPLSLRRYTQGNLISHGEIVRSLASVNCICVPICSVHCVYMRAIKAVNGTKRESDQEEISCSEERREVIIQRPLASRKIVPLEV